MFDQNPLFSTISQCKGGEGGGNQHKDISRYRINWPRGWLSEKDSKFKSLVDGSGQVIWFFGGHYTFLARINQIVCLVIDCKFILTLTLLNYSMQILVF